MKSLRPRILLLTAAVLAWPVLRGGAHIVPPEQLHPVTESYRRLAFLLDLNPVVWDEVGRDTTVIANGLEAVEPDKGRAYRCEVGRLISGMAATAGPDPADGPPTTADRKGTARRVFGLSAGAVVDKLGAHLALARSHLGTAGGRAALELEEARQLFLAFEPDLRVADPEGYRALGRSWLELAGALGSPGVFGLGAVAPDEELFAREASEVRRYLELRVGTEDGERTAADSTAADSTAADSTAADSAAADVTVAEVTAVPRLVELPSQRWSMVAGRRPPRRLPPGADLNKQLPRPRQILNMAARGVDEGETTLIALGDMAFDSPVLYGEPARSLGLSCNTCHNKGVTNPGFFIPGLSARTGGLDVSNSFFAGHANNGVFDHVDIPDLRGIRYTGPYGRDGRFASLREFTRNVIVNEFNGPEPAPVLLDGLVAYLLQFDFLPNPFLEADGSLSDRAGAAALRGEAIFHRPFARMGGRSCASCHVPADHFLDRRRHDIGTVAGVEPSSRDRALDTPTLLSAKYTAPYFHDGRAPTLRAVNEWFNEHYGLGLSDAELADLTAYVETVGEGNEAYEDTVFTLGAELEEFSFFLSTYEFLRDRRQEELLDVTFETIALEIRAHKWDVRDDRYLPVLDRLADLMDAAGDSRRLGDLAAVDARVAEYRDLYEEKKEVLR